MFSFSWAKPFHRRYPYAVLMVIIYPVGIPTYFAMLLHRYRHILNLLANSHALEIDEKKANRLRRQTTRRSSGRKNKVPLVDGDASSPSVSST